jgi:hypothetical protein
MLAAAVLLAAATLSEAQYSEFGGIDSFFKANVNLPNAAEFANRNTNAPVNYMLVDQSDLQQVIERLVNGGMTYLGVSSFRYPLETIYGGVPAKAAAISYAKSIGAEVVIYTLSTNTDTEGQWNNHSIYFYARTVVPGTSSVQLPNMITNEQATAAFNFLQDQYGRPRLRTGMVTYDSKTDSYTWIGPKLGKRMSQSRASFISQVWANYIKNNR